MSGYQKSGNAKATVAESQALAANAVYPAIVGTRFALVLSVVALIVASIALAVAVAK